MTPQGKQYELNRTDTFRERGAQINVELFYLQLLEILRMIIFRLHWYLPRRKYGPVI